LCGDAAVLLDAAALLCWQTYVCVVFACLLPLWLVGSAGPVGTTGPRRRFVEGSGWLPVAHLLSSVCTCISPLSLLLRSDNLCAISFTVRCMRWHSLTWRGICAIAYNVACRLISVLTFPLERTCGMRGLSCLLPAALRRLDLILYAGILLFACAMRACSEHLQHKLILYPTSFPSLYGTCLLLSNLFSKTPHIFPLALPTASASLLPPPRSRTPVPPFLPLPSSHFIPTFCSPTTSSWHLLLSPASMAVPTRGIFSFYLTPAAGSSARERFPQQRRATTGRVRQHYLRLRATRNWRGACGAARRQNK